MPPPRVMKVLGVVVTATATVALLLLFKQMKSGVEETKQKHKTKEKKKSKMKKNALQLWAAAAHPATDLKVFVGTQSKLKLEAVRTAFSDLNRTVSVVGFKAKSRVSEQPYGHEETRRGAMNRLSHAKSLAKEQTLWQSATGKARTTMNSMTLHGSLRICPPEIEQSRSNLSA
mmetsp:Transcript_4788/g.7595  ORF Transcript_4788/g.7595 Transcript_4788/m.7595 type:complete len:173 (+) Transcript_4788:122-640(+)